MSVHCTYHSETDSSDCHYANETSSRRPQAQDTHPSA
ncbi:predicted protein [Plenodomus lingam JN3]|uniref:Predicted protein n=1 Tax=Leptosphaeria maculans (strain JN3 / isolate v23.1.3 / race Av1-4-5-6-7-8) TaxID=985895 RepID=E4ZUS0_LEPMJ|nr:predicted protein [Plenodomus lingam JN3]CBX95149.1 predicted protein [Plenodomus lingam JN3]